jgi:hypothetical protein
MQIFLVWHFGNILAPAAALSFLEVIHSLSTAKEKPYSLVNYRVSQLLLITISDDHTQQRTWPAR